MDPGVEIEIDDLKAYNKGYVTLFLDGYNNNGFVFNGNTFQSDEVSRANISGSATLAIILLQKGFDFPSTFTWRTKDNQDVSINAAGIISMGTALFTFLSGNYLYSFTHKTAIDNLTTIQDLINYDITTGWQGIYPW